MSWLSKAEKWIVAERIIMHNGQELPRGLQVAVLTLEEGTRADVAELTADLSAPDVVLRLPTEHRVME